MKFEWNAEAVGLLTCLAPHRSTSEMASDLSIAFGVEITKNMVMGAAHRRKIPLLGAQKRKPAPPKPRPTNTAQKVRAVIRTAKDTDQAAPAIRSVSDIMNRPRGRRVAYTGHSGMMCSWVYDARGHDGLPMLCGETKVDKLSYCPHHMLRIVRAEARERVAKILAIPADERKAA